VADRVLGDLHQNAVAGLERQLDATGLVLGVAVGSGGIPVHLTGVQHGVTAAPDVDECGFHAGKNVLHTTEVHVADQARLGGLGDVVLHQYAIFEHGDLGAVELRTHNHLAVDALAASEELGFGDHRATTTGVAAVTSALLLRFETRRALDALRLGNKFGLRLLARLAHLHHGVRVGVSGARFLARAATRATTNVLRFVVLLVIPAVDLVLLALLAAIIVATGVVTAVIVTTVVVTTRRLATGVVAALVALLITGVVTPGVVASGVVTSVVVTSVVVTSVGRARRQRRQRRKVGSLEQQRRARARRGATRAVVDFGNGHRVMADGCVIHGGFLRLIDRWGLLGCRAAGGGC
jgi:hypothetical protein